MARKGSAVDVELFGVVRLANSRNGNPRFVLVTDAGNFFTSSDASCSYDVENVEGERRRLGSRRLRLHLTAAGRVSWFLRLGGDDA